MLTKEEKSKIEAIIIQQIKKTEDDVEDLEDFIQPIAPENAIGRISRMDAINNKTVNEAGLRNAKEKLLRLIHALNSIKSKDFGKCVRCGNVIPFGRLMLMPESTKCMNCASR